MKTLSILFLSWQLILLTGCSKNESIQLIANPILPLYLIPVNIPTSLSQDSPIPEQVEKPIFSSQNVIPVEEELVPSLEIKESITSSIDEPNFVPSIIENDTLKPTLPLYLENGVERGYYETLPYLSPSDMITVRNEEGDEYATVQYDHYQVITDANGSQRQGIAFYFTESNISESPIEVGLPGRVLHPIVNISVFYDEKELKKMPADEMSIEFADQEYLIEQHVHFTKEQANMEPCSTPATLNPGESRICYHHYSYAGKGDYLINQAIDSTYSHYQSFLINVK